MGQLEPWRQAIALSRYDLPDHQDLMVHGCEDCACAVSDDQAATREVLPPPPVMTGSWMSANGVAEFPLDARHVIAFNPLSGRGAVVLNDAACEVLRRFRKPVTLPELERSWPGHGAEISAIAARLGQLELIHPAGQPLRPQFADGQILTAWLHVTNGCNLRCPYCYINKSAQPMDEQTGRAAVAAVISSAARNGFRAVKLKYAGGEASLNYRLVISLHDYARQLAAESGLHLYATLLSNGVRLPADLVDICKAEGIRIMISLDGVGEEHDVQRFFANGRPSFHLVDRTIANLIEQGLSPHLSVTISKRNADSLADVIRFALERNLTFSLNLFRDNECASSFTDLRYEEQAMIAALLKAFRAIEEYLPRWSVLGSILDRGQLLAPRQRSCGVGHDYVVIDQHGQVAKCHMEIERTLGSVFASDPLQLVRQDTSTALNLIVDEKDGCRDCMWRYWCSGGCAVATFRATGRYDVKSPNCNIYKAIYPEALRLEGLRLLRYAT
jgi:uncharacterized protein